MHIFDIAKEFEEFIRASHPDLDILIVSMYRRAVTQILNLQSMPWKTYKEIFMKYRGFFRKNTKRVMQDERMAKKAKIYHLLLCGRPELFYMQRKMLPRAR